MYAPGYTPPPGGMTDTGEMAPSMSADQIRAEIARLQEMLEQIEDKENGKNDPDYTNWLKEQEQKFRAKGIYDYFEVKNGQLVYNPELARSSEYTNWQSHVSRLEQLKRNREEKEREELTSKEQEKMSEMFPYLPPAWN